MPPPVDLAAFEQRLRLAFPPHPFDGLVSTHGECDDGIHLRRELPGRRWDELSPNVLFHGSIALPLLEPDALVAFLPAWLLRSFQTFGRDSLLLEFTLYFLCPGSDDEGWDDEHRSERIARFNPAQRGLVGELLQAIVNDPALEVWRPRAEYGLRSWLSHP